MESQASSVRGRLRKIMASAHLSVWEKAAPPQLSPWCQTIYFLLICLWCFLNCCPHAEVQREWVWVSLCMGPLRRTAWDSGNFCLPHPQFPLVFTARNYRNLSYWHWNPGWGHLLRGWNRSLPRQPSRFLSATHVCGSSHSTSPPLLSVSMWFLLEFRSYRTSIQLNF